MLYAHPVFEWIRSVGIEHDVMMKTFNMGYGFTFISSINNWNEIEKAVGEKLFLIGNVA